MRPSTINYHLHRACNARCRFCFATFRDVGGQLSTEDSVKLLEMLRREGGEKITFAGGEPTLHPDIGFLVSQAKRIGFRTSIVTNGARLAPLLDGYAADIDWVGISVDSANETTQVTLGRGLGDHVARAVDLAARCHEVGVRVKLNTVVTALTWWEDMGALVRRVRPRRWKVFQVLPVAGQNDESVGDLLISGAQFKAFVTRHAYLADEGFAPVPEDNVLMTGSYVMVDPLGRFFSNTLGRHSYSAPILEVGVNAAWAEVAFDEDRFDRRGGRYEW